MELRFNDSIFSLLTDKLHLYGFHSGKDILMSCLKKTMQQGSYQNIHSILKC